MAIKFRNTPNKKGVITQEDTKTESVLVTSTTNLAAGNVVSFDSDSGLVDADGTSAGKSNGFAGVVTSDINKDSWKQNEYCTVVRSGNVSVESSVAVNRLDDVRWNYSTKKFVKTAASPNTVQLVGAKFNNKISSAGLVSVFIPEGVTFKKD